MIVPIIFIIFFDNIISKCAFTSNCTDIKDSSTCGAPIEKIQEPQQYQYTKPFECKDIDQKYTCCNDIQHTLMSNNFQIIDASFGSGNGGCDICGANLKRLWCHFTCSPQQTDFMQIHGKTIVKDPSDESKMIEVLNITLTLTSEYACYLFNSCKKTPFVTQVSAMQTAAGFVKFMGRKAVVKGKTLINMEFSQNNGLNFTIIDCNYKAINNTDPVGYFIKQNCTCNNCDLSCNKDLFQFEDEPQLEGFDQFAVSGMFSVMIILTFIKWKFAKY